MRRACLVLGLASLAEVAVAGLYPGITPDNHTCALVEPVLSCSCKAKLDKVEDTCCVETFGGLLVATQLWSTFTGLEDKGQIYPKNDWSIHGLWPDFCNGSYTQYCDLSRQYDPKPSPNTTNGQPGGIPVPAYKGEPIETWFGPYGKLDLLAYMNKYWVSQLDPNWVFWAHEFSKHATCFSTFQKECYGPKAAEHDDLFDFFETVVTWQRRLPSFRWLSDAGIRPSNRTSYTLSDIRHALTKEFGQQPFIGCGGPKYNETEAGKGSKDNGRTEINELWYFYHVNGTPQRGDAEKLDAGKAGGRLTTCAQAKGAIKYYERTKGSEE
ncbi:Ribonuclease T2-like 1-A [Metarhizium brunneum]|uniref:ribonuclease T2 n=1 Tax=Metarhizium brunneum TaxID=500148 RepID=A0A7D5YR36_9HYPO|nr:Ribonuclease T2-like 1-A [Metarhizium brunneum]